MTKNDTEIFIFKLININLTRNILKGNKRNLTFLKSQLKNGFLKGKFRNVNEITKDLTI